MLGDRTWPTGVGFLLVAAGLLVGCSREPISQPRAELSSVAHFDNVDELGAASDFVVAGEVVEVGKADKLLGPGASDQPEVNVFTYVPVTLRVDEVYGKASGKGLGASASIEPGQVVQGVVAVLDETSLSKLANGGELSAEWRHAADVPGVGQRGVFFGVNHLLGDSEHLEWTAFALQAGDVAKFEPSLQGTLAGQEVSLTVIRSRVAATIGAAGTPSSAYPSPADSGDKSTPGPEPSGEAPTTSTTQP